MDIWVCISNIADVLGIIGFILTAFTFVLALIFSVKLKSSSDKQQYLSKRDKYRKLIDKHIRQGFNFFNEKYFHEVNHELSMLAAYDFWKEDDKSIIDNFFTLTIELNHFAKSGESIDHKKVEYFDCFNKVKNIVDKESTTLWWFKT